MTLPNIRTQIDSWTIFFGYLVATGNTERKAILKNFLKELGRDFTFKRIRYYVNWQKGWNHIATTRCHAVAFSR